MDALQRLAARTQSNIVSRQDLITIELPTIVAETQSIGLTTDQTLSRELQSLGDKGFIDRIDRGRYRLLKPIVEAEDFSGDDIELDNAIRECRLKIGRVETADVLQLQNRRRGQQRLRRLALNYYDCQCAICDIREESFLVASHIVPWAQSEDGAVLRNVIVLCRPHDCLFEYGYWSLMDDLTIVRKPQQPMPWVIAALLPPETEFRSPVVHTPGDFYVKDPEIGTGLVGFDVVQMRGGFMGLGDEACLPGFRVRCRCGWALRPRRMRCGIMSR